MSNTVKMPFLPGYNIEVEKPATFNKSHAFDVANGLRTENTLGSVAVDTSGLAVNPKGLTEMPWANTDMGTQKLPAWVAYDRKVLRFFAFFKEAVFSSSIETYRVRKCVIYYYLEDDSIHVAEPKVENSGIPQGVLIRRHRVPKTDGTCINLGDLQVGADISMYGRTFRITDADTFTRDYYVANGASLSPAVETPQDNFTKRSTVEPTTYNKLMHPMKEHMEASLGKQMGINIRATQQFLQNDGKVLRFYCIFRDNKLYGELRPYIVHYFLADDTVEVLEVKDANNGRDPSPALLKRQKLPRRFIDVSADCASIGTKTRDSAIEYYCAQDIAVGTDLIVYGRPLTVMGADEFTKNYYIEKFGANAEDFPPISYEPVPEKEFYITAPPHNGIGTEEDSLGSFVYLNPKIPKIDYRKLIENDGIICRYVAKFVNPASEDVNRRFVISFFIANDTVQIFERFERNSGFIGGNFMERCRQKNVDTDGKYFKCSDFEVGRVVTINTFKFEIIGQDLYTENYRKANPHMFT